MTYEEKLKIANEYLASKCDFGWNDLEDINSLHNANDKKEIIALCDNRLNASGFITEDIDIFEGIEDDDDIFIDDLLTY